MSDHDVDDRLPLMHAGRRLGHEQSVDRSELTTQVVKRAGQAMSQVWVETQFDARAEKIKGRPEATIALSDELTGSRVRS